ncbi:amino acid ABC transporter permease [Ureibacillus acetophenoni]|uniref:L-cystine transport system permease protein n=1 Tax=Ureibacillus acetophenoni TaxID=614649 RepID=A0A285UFS9_9BACL|nr:amino acid ABC transporter permease [Ureibacillus acetophenoni]SOC40730.1 L-cystine transport system permease protein [Ureibacillus acetophenoni]
MQLDIPFIWTAFTEIIKALPLTLIIAIAPILIGLLIGIAVAFLRMNPIKILTPIANFYVSFYRGTPVIMHIMIIYFGVPILFESTFGISLNFVPIAVFVIIALALNAGAYLSEIIRSGILSVSKGQIDAAYSIGMTTSETLRRIVLPQAFASAIPNLTNIIIGFLHATSIAFLVSVKELTGAANIVASSNLKFLEAFIAVGIIYWGITIIIELFAQLIERKITAYSNTGVARN